MTKKHDAPPTAAQIICAVAFVALSCGGIAHFTGDMIADVKARAVEAR